MSSMKLANQRLFLITELVSNSKACLMNKLNYAKRVILICDLTYTNVTNKCMAEPEQECDGRRPQSTVFADTLSLHFNSYSPPECSEKLEEDCKPKLLYFAFIYARYTRLKLFRFGISRFICFSYTKYKCSHKFHFIQETFSF